MKKITLFIPLSVAAAMIVSAQKLTLADVPAKVKATFAKQHPSLATVKWEKEKGDYEAGFKMDGKTISELYSADGTMKESEVDIKTSELPSSVQGYVKNHYKGSGIREAAKITAANGTVTYEAEVKKMDVIFDAAGNFLKEVKD